MHTNKLLCFMKTSGTLGWAGTEAAAAVALVITALSRRVSSQHWQLQRTQSSNAEQRLSPAYTVPMGPRRSTHVVEKRVQLHAARLLLIHAPQSQVVSCVSIKAVRGVTRYDIARKDTDNTTSAPETTTNTARQQQELQLTAAATPTNKHRKGGAGTIAS